MFNAYELYLINKYFGVFSEERLPPLFITLQLNMDFVTHYAELGNKIRKR